MKKLFLAVGVFAFFSNAFAYEKEVLLHIKGMTCPTCTRAVKLSLQGVEGVKSAKVYLNGEKAVVSLQKEVSFQTLADAVKKAGYNAEEIK